MKDYFFTFGSNHRTSRGTSLGNCYVVIKAPNEGAARDIMFDTRGDEWAFSYPSAEAAGVDRFYLNKVSLDEVRL